MFQNLLLPPFTPPKWLANPHCQTILPKFLPQPTPNYQRKLHLDSTQQTYVAYDFVHCPTPRHQARPLAVMFHGLEGSSQSHYAKAFANFAIKHGWDSVVVHYRGCGDVKNTAKIDYTAGDSQEIAYVLQQLQARHRHLCVVGVSLGGNMLAKYMAEAQQNALCLGAVTVSAPVDLATSAVSMQKFIAKHIYSKYLLQTLIKKSLQNTTDPTTYSQLKHIKTIDKFDDLYTAPKHGYGDVKNYYQQASALPLLKQIAKPTLMICAKDDPFLGKIAQDDDISPNVRLLYSPHGGHVGFLNYQNQHLTIDWLPSTIFEFFDWLMHNA